MIKLRNGVWHVDARVDGRRVRASLNTPDRAEALRRAGAMLDASTGQDVPVQVAGPTLRETFDRALREHGRWRDAKSQRTLWSTYGSLVAHFGEDRKMRTIDRAAALGYLESLRAEGLAGSTLNARQSMLNVLWKYAGIDRPQVDRARVRPGRIRTLSVREELLVLDWFRVARMDDMAALTEFLLDTGCRLSEALRANAHHLEVDVLAVWENKADHPRRIPLTPRALHAMGRFDHLTVDTADAKWAKMRESVGLAHDKQFVIHALRHTRATRMAAEGHAAPVIQQWMGHKSLATTMRYIHLDVAALRRALPRAQNGYEPTHIGLQPADSEQ